MNKALTTLFALATLATVGCGIDGTLNESFELSEPITAVTIELGASNVVVAPSEDGLARVVVDVGYWDGRPELTVLVDGGALVVDLDCPAGCAGLVTVSLPSEVDVTIDSGSGNIQVLDMDGAITASNGSGKIGVDGAHGPLSLETGSGGIHGQNLVSGQCFAQSGSGRIKLNFLEPPHGVDLIAGSGRVVLDLPRGTYDLRLQTGSGDLNLTDLAEDPDSPFSIRVESGSGDVDIRGH